MQNFAAHGVLTDTQKFDHFSPVLQDLGWLFIKDQLLVHDAIQIYKIVNSYAPSYLSSFISKRSHAQNNNTRQSVNLDLPQCRTATAQRSFHFRSVNI